MADARFEIYSHSKVITDRPDCVDVAGTRVLIIGRRLSDDGMWIYTVTPDDPDVPDVGPCTYECPESELSPIESEKSERAHDAFADSVFRVANVDFQVRSAWLVCTITDGGTNWDITIDAYGRHRGQLLSPRVTLSNLIITPPGAIQHWAALDNTIVEWQRCYESKFQARLNAMKSHPIRNGHAELSYLQETMFRLNCSGTSDIGWEPDLTWDLPLGIDTRVEFAGVRGGLASVFPSNLFELGRCVRDSRDKMYRPKSRDRSK